MQDSPAGASLLYIALPFVSWSLHEGERLVLPQDGLKAQPLHETLCQTLMLCDQWRSLDRHVEVALKRMPDLKNHAQQLKQGLIHMVQQGLLVDSTKLSQKYLEGHRPEPESKGIETLYVRTYRCPQALERLLSSLKNGRAGASVKTVVIVDDARDTADIERSQTLLAAYQNTLSARLIHITRKDRERMADALALACGIDAQHLRWWLNGDPDDPEMSAGATFNTALLLSAGTATAILDDDAQLTPYGNPNEISEIALAHEDDTEWTLYSSAEEMENAWSPLDIDPLAAHSHWLGRSLPSLLDQTSNKQRFWHPVSSSELHNLQPSGKVKVSVNGLLGDPGTGSASWLYTQPPERLAPWIQNEATYQQTVSQRAMARKPLGKQILSHHSLLSPLVAIDNSDILPPTFPNGRGEDLLFTELVCAIYPDSLFTQLPWMLKHIPENAREFTRESLLQPISMSTNRLLANFLQKSRYSAPNASPATRFNLLADSLKALAESPGSTLASEYRNRLNDDRAYMAQKLIHNIRALQPPKYVADDMQKLLQQCYQGVASDEQDEKTSLQQARERATHYSSALASWQIAWEYCKSLGEAKTLLLATPQ
ncbi:hypothetical protein [Gilvimarinus chinensis]|uniref:hypothetical protein n=1 Tax=Gilvimarinus chinensis TaxID=396005 RepID=UPI0012FC990E|nr:hypothetical protein [Gilvimarinus chinensis]